MLSVQHGENPKVVTVANLFREICYNNKDALSAGIIVAGWDKYSGGQVFSVPLGGSLHKQPFAIGGSGSTYIYGWCDAEYRDGMTQPECLKFVSTGESKKFLSLIS
jgi:20S proteasome subunit beta 1